MRARSDMSRGMRVLAILSILVLGATALCSVSPAFGASAKVRIPRAPREKILPYSVVAPQRRASTGAPQDDGPRANVALPSAGTALVTLPAGSARAVKAGALPLHLGRVVAGPRTRPASNLTVSLMGQDAARRAKVPGLLFSVSGASVSSPATRITLNYSAFANAGGANWGQRLQLVQLPACSLITPELPRCQVATPITSSRNNQRGQLSAVLPGSPTARRTSARTSATSTSAPSQTMVMAAVAGSSSSNGSFTASSLAPSGSWAAGGASGAFTYGYPLTLPPAGTGGDVAPKITLAYNSAAIDGQMSTTNNQSSFVGEGWNYDPGYVERTYRTCADDKTLPSASQTQDLCWAGNLLTLHLPSGPTESLVRDDSTGTWHEANDNGDRVELKTGANNGARSGEYWLLTTKDGTQYTFGLNVLPGGTTSNATNSVWTVPVYGSKSGDPCYSTTGFSASRCTQAWRWNLDLVQDTNHNAAAYFYTAETNYYGANKATTPIAYTRDGYLSRIDYGLTTATNNVFAISAPQRVTFNVAERCLPAGTMTCSDAQFTTANAASWPDTPVDQNCASTGTCNNHSPTFWTRKRVTSIATSYYNGSAYKTVDSYALSQSFPNTGDPEMALNSIVRTAYGTDGTSIVSPAVSFTGQEKANRVYGYNSQPEMLHNRLTSITTETGEIISVHYSGDSDQAGRAKPLCTSTTVPASPSQDTSECYPVYWTPSYQTTAILDYFHKYLVTQVDVQDHNATSPTRTTTYTYLGDPAWHFDDNEIVKPANRTYGQFRGYGQVETRTGNPNDNVTGLGPDAWTLSRSTYFRGMDGDTLPGGGTRSVSITDSMGVSHPDTNQFANMLLEKTTFDGSAQTATTISTYSVIATTASRTRTGLPAQTASVIGQTASTTYTAKAAGGNLVGGTATSYDTLGRPMTVLTTGTGVAPSCVKTSYADNTTAWIRDRPSEVVTYDGNCSSTTVARDTRTYYDNATTLGTVSVGNATEVDRAKDLNGSTLEFVKSTTAYDGYGRPTSTTAYDPGTSAGNRTTTTAYTPAATGALTKTVTTNPKTQTTTAVFDPSRGVTTQSTDVAGRVTSGTYDAMGRLTAIWRPGQVQGTDSATEKYSYLLGPNAPLAVTTQTLVDPGNGATPGYVTKVDIYDAFGALRQTQADGVGGGRTVTDTFNDSHAWPVMVNDHWFTSGTPSTTLISTASSGIDDRKINIYDGTGRIVQANEYRGDTQTSSTRTIYGGDRTTVIPPTGGIASTSIVDGSGRKVEFDQYKTLPTINGNVVSGGTYQRQTHSYDSQGQQTGMTSGATDSGSTSATNWSTSYDLLGRTVTTTSPDSGTTTNSYYDTGEIATSTDGAGRVLAYDYDSLGRKIGKYAGSLTGTKLAAWAYDTKTNGVGQLASSTSYVGAYSYTTNVSGYDAYGNQLGTDLTSTNPALALMSHYATTQSWTKTHLLTKKVLASTAPSANVGTTAETLTYWYDSHGDPNGLSGLNGYVTGATYSPYGELSQYVLGANNLTGSLTYSRDAQTRRITDVNLSGQSATPQLEDVAYTYDLSGNVTKSVDVQGGSGAPTETQCFSYDGLQQLTQAWSSLDSCGSDPTTLGNNSQVGGPQTYWTSWSFDDGGSRSGQVQHAAGSLATDVSTGYVTGDASHPHALTSATTTGATTSNASFSYNLDGAMKTRTVDGAQTSFGYGPDGLLNSVTAPSGASTYIPDADGNTLARTNPDGTTILYLPGQQATISAGATNVTVNKYYDLGGVTVATRVDRGNALYLLADQHGSNQVAVDPTTWAVTRRYLDPYGNQLGAVTGGTWPGDRGFLNKPVNGSTGLLDIGAREYDPVTGRFTSVDPMLAPDDPQQANGYAYADNNPMTNSDPTGLMREPDGGGDYVPPPLPPLLPTPTGPLGPYIYPHVSPLRTTYKPPPPHRYDFFKTPCMGWADAAGCGMDTSIGFGHGGTWASNTMRAWNLSPDRLAGDPMPRSVSAAGTTMSRIRWGNPVLRNFGRLARSDYVDYASKGLGALSAGLTFADDMSQGHSAVYSTADAGATLAGGMEGAAVGAEVGAEIGSIVPGAGTLVGGAVGGLVGGIVGSGLGHAAVSAVSDFFSGW